MISARGGRFVAMATGALLLAAYTLNVLLLLATLAVFVAVATELLVFHRRLPGPDRLRFRVERSGLPRVLSPGGEADLEITIHCLEGPPALAELRDILPSSLAVVGGSPVLHRRWRKGDVGVIRYRVRAGDRGSHVAGPVAVTVDSPHRLAWSQWLLPETDAPVRVVPPAPIERARRIGPALFTRVQGRMALRHRGYGTEFRSLRPYQLSDDFRHIAWKRCRPGQLFVREFEQESRQDFVLLLDVTPAMLAGLAGENALDRAIEAASLVTAAVARSGEDRVGLLTFTHRPRQYLRPSRGEYHFRLLAENLAFLRPVEGTFDLTGALEFLTRRLVTSTHILAFTPLDGPLEGLHTTHARFRARGHHLYLFPPNRAEFYPPLEPGHVAEPALRWAAEDEEQRLGRGVSEIRGEGIPVFPYDRRGATTQVLSTYGQLRAWGMA